MIEYIQTEKSISDLKMTHPMFEKIFIPIFEQYAIEAKHFNYYDLPVVTEDDFVLTHVDAVRAEKRNRIEIINVMVAKGLQEDEAPRFINYGLFVKNLHKEQRKDLVLYLRDYLNTPKGREWKKTLKGDINEKVATIVGCSKGAIKLWLSPEAKPLLAYEPIPDAIESQNGQQDESREVISVKQ